MSAVDERFRQLRDSGSKALLPFVTAGDPDIDFTLDLIRALDRVGCSLCEIGIPYSDPIADGPVIQASYTRALAKRITLERILQGVTSLGTVEMPRVTMVSYAIVFRHGLERYVEEAQSAGISGAIVPDLLVEESGPLAEICRRKDFSLIQLVTPTTPRERALRVAESSSGFLYYVSVTGITGERQALPASLTDSVGWLREQTELPVCIGFGISQVEHVQRLREVADGLIVGSAFVRRIAEVDQQGREQVIEEVSQFATELLGALNPSR